MTKQTRLLHKEWRFLWFSYVCLLILSLTLLRKREEGGFGVGHHYQYQGLRAA